VSLPTESNFLQSVLSTCGSKWARCKQRQDGLILDAARFATSLSQSINHLETLYYWRRVFEYWKEADIFYLSESMIPGSKTKEMTCTERRARLQVFVRQMDDAKFSSGKMPKKLHPILVKGEDGKDICNVQAYQLPQGPQIGQFIGFHLDAFALEEEFESILNALEETLGRHDRHTGLCATKSLLDVWNSDFDVKHSCTLSDTEAGRSSPLHDSSSYGISESSHDRLPEPSSIVSTLLRRRMIRELASIFYKITTSVPLVSDYACSICYEVAFLPIRLECQHRFCLRCLVSFFIIRFV
jgi:hypothetical protein